MYISPFWVGFVVATMFWFVLVTIYGLILNAIKESRGDNDETA